MNAPINPHPQHVLPSSPYGITSTRYVQVDNPLIPLPRRNLMLAANALNDYRAQKLSDWQRTFLDVYLSSGFNAGVAALKSGKCTHLSQADAQQFERECASVGKRIAKKPYMQRAIQLAQNYFAEDSRIDTRRLIAELSNIAYANMGDYQTTDEDGETYLRMPEDHERGKLAVIQEITQVITTSGSGDKKRVEKRTKFKLYSKRDAIGDLLKIAATQGDPEVAGLDAQQGDGGTTVNIFNIMPVPSGEFIPAPLSAPHSVVSLPQGHAPLQIASAAPVPTQASPSAPGIAPEWEAPDRSQKRQLTIDHIP